MRKQRRQHGAHRTASANPPPPEAADRPGADPVAAALRMMQDEGQPAAMRARMAKAAMAALNAPGRSGTPDPEGDQRPSHLETARRIALIFQRANEELRAAELAAEGWDVTLRGMPVDNTDWTRIVGRLAAILASCHSPIESLDRAGIRF